MVKYLDNKSDCELSTNQSHCSDSELNLPETLEAIIEQLPKLTQAEKKQSYHMVRSNKTASRKWSQAETNRFYELLGHYGLDFTVISYHPFFANRRSQKELSNKYKK
jgi:isocitrate lyase